MDDGKSVLLQLHGTFMVLAWILFASCGTVVARYFKKTWVLWRCYGYEIWFVIHVSCMAAVWLLTITAIILAIIGLGGFEFTWHAFFGWVVTLVTLVMPVAEFFRPDSESERRTVFRIGHLTAGFATHSIAVTCLFLAIYLRRAWLPSWLVWDVAGFLAVHVMFHSAFMILDYLGNKKAEERGKLNDQAYSTYRKIYLAIYVTLMLTYCIYTIFMVWKDDHYGEHLIRP